GGTAVRLRAFASPRLAVVARPVPDSGRALDALGLGCELLGRRVSRLRGAEEVEVVHPAQTGVDQDRPVRGRLEPLCRPLVKAVHQRKGALELIHGSSIAPWRVRSPWSGAGRSTSRRGGGGGARSPAAEG